LEFVSDFGFRASNFEIMLIPKHKLRLIVVVVAVAALFNISSRIAFIQNALDATLSFLTFRNNTVPQLSVEGDLQEAQARIRTLEEENKALSYDRELLLPPTPSRILVKILWYDPALLAERIRINRGEREGIREGAAVTAAGERLVGRVTAVYPHTAEVELVTSPVFGGVSVTLQDAVGLAVPSLGGVFTVQFISREDVPEAGTEVRTAGRGDNLPQGLLLGYVAEVETSPKDPFARISVTPALEDTFSILFVSPFAP